MTEPRQIKLDPPYLGSAGRTRTERVRVFRPAREPLEVEVFRVLNVGDHPDLREAALDGTLNRLEDGEDIEVPYVFHDPTARQLALVIPDGARARELSERARLLEQLDAESEHAVPEYVRRFAIVYGHRGLRAFVENADAMEVDVHELEPVDTAPPAASYYPRLGGVLPRASALHRVTEELIPLVDENELWLFATLTGDEAHSFAESSSDLLLQLKTVEGLPVCVLALVDSRTGVVRRAYLNPSRAVDAPILDLLRREFVATVVVLDAEHRLLRAFELQAPRSANAGLILARTDQAPTASPPRWERAADACRAAPPPARPTGHPFVLTADAPDAATALRRLLALESWSTSDRADEALLFHSVPYNTYELARRRIVMDAVRFGLAMSDHLLLQAVDFGLGPDAPTLVAALVRRFAEMLPSASEQGLGADEIAANSEALERLSVLHGTSTGPDLSCNIKPSG